MIATATPAGERIAAELASARRRVFLGRAAELAAFRDAFRDALRERGGTAVWHVYGPGGIGTSTLLRRLADEARAAGRPVFEADLAALTTPGAFVAAGRAMLRRRPAVIVVDNAEPSARDVAERLARLRPPPAIILLGGRGAPVRSPRVYAVRLGPWSPDEARDYLVRRGVPAADQGPLLAFAHGHPAALSLAATAAVRDRTGGKWAPSPALTAELRDRLVGTPPTPAHRRALDVCAHAPAVTEKLLQAVIGPRAAELYRWLGRQPFVEATPAGLRADEVVRATLDADLRWRDPAGYQRLHEQITGHLLRRAQTAHRAGDGEQAAGALYRLVFPADPMRGADPAEVVAPADPVGAAAAAHVRRMSSRPGEQWLLQRLAVAETGDPPARPWPEHGFALWLRTKRLAWSFVAVPESVDRSRCMALLDHWPIAPDSVGGHRIYAHDWRAVPATAWLSRVNAASLYGIGAITAPPEPDVLGADEFAAAVRDLLRGWHRAATAASSPLLRTRLVTAEPADGDPVARLRAALADAVASLGDERSRTVVAATYFDAIGAQPAVAEHLRLPYGTYRRHLARGVDRVVAILWERESGADDVR